MTFGISEKMQGRRYIYDGIYYLVCEDDKTDVSSRISILSYIAHLHKKADSGVYKAIQNAIKRAWRMTPPSELEKLYTAKINYNTGIPTPAELISHYADKIKKELK